MLDCVMRLGHLEGSHVEKMKTLYLFALRKQFQYLTITPPQSVNSFKRMKSCRNYNEPLLPLSQAL